MADTTRRPGRVQRSSFISIPGNLLQTIGSVTIDTVDNADYASEVAPHVITIKEQAANNTEVRDAEVSGKKEETQESQHQNKKAVMVMTPNTDINTRTDYFGPVSTYEFEGAPHILQDQDTEAPVPEMTEKVPDSNAKRGVTIMTPRIKIATRPRGFNSSSG